MAATIADGQLCEVHAVAWPAGDGRSIAINDYAIPVLDAVGIAGGHGQFDTISGATYTSRGLPRVAAAAAGLAVIPALRHGPVGLPRHGNGHLDRRGAAATSPGSASRPPARRWLRPAPSSSRSITDSATTRPTARSASWLAGGSVSPDTSPSSRMCCDSAVDSATSRTASSRSRTRRPARSTRPATSRAMRSARAAEVMLDRRARELHRHGGRRHLLRRTRGGRSAVAGGRCGPVRRRRESRPSSTRRTWRSPRPAQSRARPAHLERGQPGTARTALLHGHRTGHRRGRRVRHDRLRDGRGGTWHGCRRTRATDRSRSVPMERCSATRH